MENNNYHHDLDNFVIDGVKFSVAQTNIKYKNRNDLLFVKFSNLSAVAGVFTKSSTKAISVKWSQDNLLKSEYKAQALVVNAGNANCFTGKQGEISNDDIVKEVAKIIGCDEKYVYIASTGVIGEYLDSNKIINCLAGAYHNLDSNDWEKVADSILTTDLVRKISIRESNIGGTIVKIGGFAKGSGMIAPNMATMLAFIFTDAKIPGKILQKLLNNAVAKSFNAITVDGDTSTNDMVLLFATGMAEHEKVATVDNGDNNAEAVVNDAEDVDNKDVNDEILQDFILALDSVCIDLAKQIVLDGEGATKFITICVKGALNSKQARDIFISVANSPLVKVALYACDANWGRIIMAIGKAEENIDCSNLSLKIGEFLVAKNGALDPNYVEDEKIVNYMQKKEITIEIDLNIGNVDFIGYTSDLTHKYIDINADYRS